MREILFRGKTKNRKDTAWIEGSLVRGIRLFDKGPATFIYDLETEMDGRGWIGNYWGEEVIPETVGQWTGLVDKNGTKIFEGDVIRNPGNVVEFCNGSFCVNGDSPLAFWTDTEVIGTIHDNTEILEDRAKPTISDEDWAEAIKYIDSLILLYSGIGMSGMFGLNMLSQLKTRYENGERTQELYDSIMACE